MLFTARDTRLCITLVSVDGKVDVENFLPGRRGDFSREVVESTCTSSASLGRRSHLLTNSLWGHPARTPRGAEGPVCACGVLVTRILPG